MKPYPLHLLIAVALALLVGGGVLAWFSLTSKDPVATRSVVEYTMSATPSGETIVSYEYVGERLPERIVADEDVTKRTPNSYTRVLGVEHKGTAQEKTTYQGTFYQDDVFVEQGGVWYYREQATTTEAAFLEAKPLYRMAKVFSATIAYAASYVDFSTSSDGYYFTSIAGDVDSGLTANFSNCLNEIDAVGGSAPATSDTISTSGGVKAMYRANGLGQCEIQRGYFTFNTASVPAGSTVSAATLQVYVTFKSNLVNDGSDTIAVYEPSATWSSWGIDLGSNTQDLTSITTSAYITFTLNATGYTFLTLGGTSELGLREGHDLLGSITTSGTAGNNILFSTSEQTGTSQDPTLSITYTAVSKAFWLFQDF